MPSPIGIEPFGTSVADVAALVPEASIPETRGAGQRAVIESDVEAWITQLTATAQVTLDDWQRLPEARRVKVQEVARTLIANAAASYLEAARAPERSGPATTTYAEVLWTRWTTGLESLAEQVRKWLDDQPETSLSKPAARFPAPVIIDRPRW